jgi:CDP-glucose 4,6-dehydratase
MKNNYFKLKKFWTGKKILITGHTGFKGSWLSIFLNLLGAKLVGYSLEPEKKSSFFYSANLKKIFFRSVYGDIRNYNKLKKTILNFSPDFIVHMAAQPLVKYSYENPLYTYEVNTIGTLNVLNIAKETKCVKNILVVTTDKVYLNLEKKVKFKERDKLGGLDPYSSSKSCAELITSSYNYSYLNKKKISVMTARAGNVIGGGDFSKDRIIPDFFRALKKKKNLCSFTRGCKTLAIHFRSFIRIFVIINEDGLKKKDQRFFL